MRLGRRSLLRLVGAAAVVGPQAVKVAQKPVEKAITIGKKAVETIQVTPQDYGFLSVSPYSQGSGYMIKLMAERVAAQRVMSVYDAGRSAGLSPQAAMVEAEYWLQRVSQGTVTLENAVKTLERLR